MKLQVPFLGTTTPRIAAVVAGFAVMIAPLVRADVLTFVTTNSSTFNVGTVSGQNGQLVNATNAVNFTQMTSGLLLIGAFDFNTAGGNNNAAIISNANLTTSGGYSIIGAGSTNNSLTLLSNSTWSASGIIIGRLDAATNNLLTINRGLGTITANELDIGWGAAASGNGMILTNGGRFTTPNLYMGSGAAANNNYLIVTGAGSIFTNTGTTYIGGTSTGGSNNSVTVANGGSYYNGSAFYLGYIGSGYNKVTVTDTGSVMKINSTLYLGYNGGGLPPTGANQLIVTNGGVVFDNGAFIGNNATTNGNSVLVTGAGSTWSNVGAITVGNIVGANSNFVTVANGAKLWTTVASTIGNGANSNNVTVAGGGALWNGGGSSITVGTGSASSNSLSIGAGGSVTNVVGLNVGITSGANFNSLIGSNSDGYFMSSGVIAIGSAANGTVGGNNNAVILSNSLLTSTVGYSYLGGASFSNSLTLLANSVWTANNGIIVGGGGNAGGGGSNGGSNNLLTINGARLNQQTAAEIDIGWGTFSSGNGVIVTNGGQVNTLATYLSAGTSAHNNYIIVTGAGSVWTNTGTFRLAGTSAGGSNNSVTIANGGRMINTGLFTITENGVGYNQVTITDPGSLLQINSTLTVGGVGAANRLLVTNQAVLEVATTMTLGNGAGNTVSNVGGVYQFTGTPVISLGSGGGIVSLSDGTISFRATASAATVAAIDGIRYAGTNTFVLNAGTNAAAGQTYTFGIIAGNPTNYANLVMVNGVTRYQGGNVTISNNGTMLASNTFATFTGVYTNKGTTAFVNSMGTFSADAYNSGTWFIDPSTNTYAGNLNNAGTMLLTNSVAIVANNFINSAGANYSMFQTSATYVAGILTNQGGLYIYNRSVLTNGNAFLSGLATALVTDAGSVWSNLSLTVGTPGAGGASVLVTNSATLYSGGASFIGNGSSNNTVTVTPSSTWNLSGGSVTIGNGVATGNVLNLNSGALTNGTVTVGGSGSSGSQFNLNGGTATVTSVTLGTIDARLNFNGGTLGTVAAGTTISGTGLVNIVSGKQALVDTMGNSATINSIIQGDGDLVKLGAGTLNIGTNNTYTGNTLITVGTLKLSAAGRTNLLPVTTPVFLANNAVFDVASNQQTIASLANYAGGGGTITNSGLLTATLTISNATGNSTFGGSIVSGVGTVSLVKAGGSTQILTGPNNYTGQTIVNGGVLQFFGGLLTNNAAVIVGTNGASFATLLATNGAELFTGPLFVGGNNSSNNTVLIANNVNWNFGGNAITIGSANGTGANGATGNVFSFSSNDQLANIGGLNLYDRNGVWLLDSQNLSPIIAGFNLGAPGMGGNSLTLSNQTVTNTTSATLIGNGSSNNTLTILAGVTWNGGNQAFTIGTGAASNNVVSILGGIVTNLGAVLVNTGSTLTVNSGTLGVTGLYTNLGTTVFIDGRGTFTGNAYNAPGAMWVIDPSTNNFGGNLDNVGTMLLTNSVDIINFNFINRAGASYSLFQTSAIYVAGVITNQGSIYIYGGSLLTNGNTFLAGSSTSVVSDAGSVWSNLSLTVGPAAAGGASVTVSNGGKLFAGTVAIGNALNSSNNAYNLGGLGTVSTISNGALTVGGSGGGFNQMTLSNANAWNSGGVTIGGGSSNNTVSVLTNATWNLLAGAVTIGSGAATGNVLMVNLGTVTNVAGGAVNIGAANTGNSNTLSIVNGGRWFGGTVTLNGTGNLYQVGGVGVASVVSNGQVIVNGFNTMNVTNAALSMNGQWVIGNNSSPMAVANVSSGATVNLLGNSILVGALSSGTGNVLTVNSGTVTNLSTLFVATGNPGSSLNTVLLTNGAQMVLTSAQNDNTGLRLGGNGNSGNSGNSLIVAGGTATSILNLNGGPILLGQAISNDTLSNNLILVSTGGIITNAGYSAATQWGIGIGTVQQGNSTSINNQVVIQNGGQFWGQGMMNIGAPLPNDAGAPKVALSNAVTVNNGLLNLAGTLTVAGNSYVNVYQGQTVLNYNSLTVTNGGSLTTLYAVNLGSATSAGVTANSNTITIVSTNSAGTASVWNMRGGALTIGNGTTTGNVLTVNGLGVVGGAVVSNVGAVTIGTASVGANNLLVITNGGQFFSAGAFAVGGAGHSNEGVVVNGGGMASAASTILSNVGLITIGNGGPNAFMIVTNATVWSAGLTIGNGSASNTVSVLTNTTWNLLTNNLTIGAGFGNVMTVSGGLLTNAGTVSLSGSGGNLSVSNGGQFFSGAVVIGTNVNANGNTYAVGGGSTPVTVFNGAITVGGTGGGSNTMTVTNANLASGVVVIGNGSTNNILNVLAGTTWNLQGNNITNGTGAAISNVFNISGATVTNVGLVTIGASGSSFSQMTVTNSTVGSIGLTIGSGATSNTVTVQAGTTWNLFGGAVTVGSAGNATGNVLNVSGSIFTNAGLINVGSAGSGFNQMTVTNATVTSIGLTIGSGSTNNTVTVLPDVAWNFGGGVLQVGSGTGITADTGNVFNVVGSTAGLTNLGGISFYDANNSLVLSNRNLASSITALNLGAPGEGGNTLTLSNQTITVTSNASTIGNGSSNNILTLLGNTVWNNSGKGITIGAAAATGNVLTINGGILTNGSVTVGTATAASNNQFIITGPSTVTLSSLAILTNNSITFNQGTLNSASTFISNGLAFAVGQVSGTTTAIFNTVLGQHGFGSGLTIFSNSWLTGSGTISAGGGNIVLTNGAIISSALGIGNASGLTVTNVYGQNGAIFDVQMNGVSGIAGVNWSLLNVNGTITNNSSIFNTNFIVRMDTLGLTLAGYSSTAAYSLKIATTTTGLAINNFSLDTNSFVTTGGIGAWTLQLNNNALYLVQSGITLQGTNYTWINTASAAWSNAPSWAGGIVPPTNGNSALVLQFNASGSTVFTASNNLVTAGNTYTNNAIAFNSSATVTNFLIGGTLTFAGSTNPAGFYQLNAGSFVVSNSVNLATNLVFDGAGLGTVILASNITGTGQITKQGGANNTVLLGSNSFVGPVLFNGGGTLTLGNIYALGTNSITVSNGTVVASVAGTSYIVGNGRNNQSIELVGSGASWSNFAAFVVGSGPVTGNLVNVNGGSLRATSVTIGQSATSVSNRLVVQNGANFLGGAPVTVGGAAGGSSNFYNVGGPGAVSTVSNGTLIVGSTGAGFNTMTVTNANLWSGALTIGSGSSNNTVSVLSNATWNLLAGAVTVGSGAATGDVLVINGGTVTGAGAVTIGSAATSIGNSLTISNGGWFSTGANSVTIGSSNSYNVGGLGASSLASNGGGISFANNFETVNVTNATLVTSGITLGNNASSDTVNLFSNATWNLMGGNLTVGSGAVTGNALNVNSATVTNVVTVIVGTGAGSYGNSVTVSNSTFFSSGATVGNGVGASNNTLTFVNSIWNGGPGALQIGTAVASSPGNNVTISGGFVTNINNVDIRGFNNSFTLTNGAQMYVVTGGGGIGSVVGENNAESNNTLYVLAGSMLTMNAGQGYYISGLWSNGGYASGGYSNQMIVNGGTFNGNVSVGGGNSGITVTNGALYGGLTISGSGDFLNVLSNGIVNLVGNDYTVKGGAQMMINGGVVTNPRNVYVNSDGTVVLTNGGTFYNPQTGGFASFPAGVGTFGVGMAGVGGQSGSGTLTISDSSYLYSQQFVVGNGGLTGIVFQTGGIINGFQGTYIGANGGLGSGQYTISGGTNLSGSIFVGGDSTGGGVGANGTLTISGSAYIQSGGNVRIGLASSGTGGGTGTVFQTGGTWNVGGGMTIAAGRLTTSLGNYLMTGGVLSNLSLSLNPGGTFTIGGSAYLEGNGGAFVINGTFNQTGGVVNVNNGILYIGNGNNGGGTYTFSGGVLSNINSIQIGNAQPFNTLTISNGGVLVTYGQVYVTANNYASGSNNTYNVGGLGLSSLVSNLGGVTVGSSGGGGNNRFTVTNAQMAISGGLTVGLGDNNDIGNVYTNATVNLLNSALTVGSTVGSTNSLTINSGGLITNSGGLYVGITAGANNNSFIVTNGGQFFMNSGTLVVGSAANGGQQGGNNNSVVLSNSTINSSGNITVGMNSASNSLTLLANTTLNGGGNSIIVGYQISGYDGMTVNGGTVSNVSGLYIGQAVNGNIPYAGNTFAISNGGSFYSGPVIVGYQLNFTNPGTSNDVYSVGGFGAPSTVSNGAITLGWNSASNTMVVTNANLMSGAVSIGNSAATNNTVTVNAGGVWNLLGNNFTVGPGATASNNVFTLNVGGIVSNVGTLIATVNSNFVTFNGGTLSANSVIYSNGLDFTVGTGGNTAVLALVSGVSTSRFQGNLVISSNATLKGTGRILTGTGKSVVITNGATIAPGNSPGILLADNMTWFGGSFFQLEITNFSGTAGVAWDVLNVTNTLAIVANGSPFTINLDTMGAPAANFDPTADANLPFVVAGNITGFNPFLFVVNTNAFANTGTGMWNVMQYTTNLYLTYSSVVITPDFIWTNNLSAPWSTANAWTNLAAPPVNGSSSLVLEFTGTSGSSYTATNDRTSSGIAGTFTNNQIVFNSGATATNVLAGATLAFAGPNAGIFQLGGGPFAISNAVTLTTNLLVRGPGLGTVILASNITGTGQITKAGSSFTLQLLGSNTFVGPVLVNAGTLTLQNQSALGTNSITVSNGTVFANAPGANSYIVGNGVSNQTLLMTGGGALWTNAAGFVVGTGAALNNAVTVQNGGQLVAAALTVGTNGASLNSLLITNGGSVLSTGATVGFAASSNSVSIVGGGVAGVTSVWNNAGNNQLVIGNNGGSGNRLVIDGNGISGGAVLTNLTSASASGALTVGGTGSDGNSLIVTNGGRLFVNGSGGVVIGNGSSNNTALVMGGGTGVSLWNNGGNVLTIGSGAASNDVLRIDGGGVLGNAVVTNVGSLTIGGANNSVILTNGGRLFASGSISIGAGGTNDSLIVVGGAANSILAGKNGNMIYVGSTRATVPVGNNNTLRIGLGGIVTNVGITVGLNSGNLGVGNSLIITNGGKLFTTVASSFGQNSSVTGKVTGANSLWNAAGNDLTVGNNANGDVLLVENGGVLANVGLLAITPFGGVGNNNQVIVSNASLTAQTIGLDGNVGGSGNQLVISGGGTVTVTTMLRNPNGVGSVALNSGWLSVASTVYSNGQNFVVGDGTSAATLQLTGTGTHLFQNNLVVTNNAALTGAGTITVAGGNGTVSILTNAMLSPGSGIGTLAIAGTNLWAGGGRYLWQISDFTGASGGGTDLVTATRLSIGASAANPFVIDISSLTLANTRGLANNFNTDNSYTLTLATASGGVLNFDAANFSLVTTNFQNANDGIWSVAQSGNSVVLNYDGATNFVWNNITGNFNTTGNWKDNASPPPATTNIVIYFGGTGSQSYAASNDVTGLVTKRIILTNQSGATQYIVGNAITLAGVAPEIRQNQTGGFVISNNLVLATNTLFSGTGSGVLEVDGSISGGYSLTKTGAYNLVLGGANSYTGSTVVADGTLTLRADSAVSVSTQTVVNSLGTLVADDGAPVVQRLTGSGSVIVSNGAALVVSNTVNSSFAGAISGDGSLTKVGGSTLTLTGTNTYRGDTSVRAGTLSITGQLLGSTNLLVSGGAFNWNSVTALTNTVLVTITGGAVNFNNDGTLNGLTGSGQFNIFGNTVQVGFAGATTNFAGTLSGSGTLSKVGAGTWTLSGGTSSLSNVVVSSGTLAVGGASLTVSNLYVTGGGLDFNAGALQAQAADFSNGQLFQIGNGRNAATYRLLGGTHNFDSDVTVASNATLTGSGTLTLANGMLLIASGATVSPAGPTAVGQLDITGTNVWGGGGRYLFNVSSYGGNVADLLNISGVLSNAATSGQRFVVDVWSPGAGFDVDANYELTLASASGGVADYAVNAFSVVVTNLGSAYDGVFRVLQSGNNLVLSYTGGVQYVWTNAVSGDWSTGSKWLGGAPPADQTNTILTFLADGVGYVANNDFVGGLVTKKLILTNATTEVTPTLTGASLSFVGNAPKLLQEGAGAYLISNEVVLATNTLFTGSGGGTVTLAGNIRGSVGAGLTKTGSWTLVLGGSNTYSGATVVQDGQLVVAHTNALRSSTLSNLVNDGVSFINIAGAQFGGLAGSGNIGLTNIDGGAVALTVGLNRNNTTYAGMLSGSGSLIKAGSGTLTLSGISTYSGGTVVNSGTLIAGALANGIGSTLGGSSIGTGAVTIAGGTLRFGSEALLAVTNTVTGSVTFNGGTLSAAVLVNGGSVIAAVNGTISTTTNFVNLSTGTLLLTNAATLEIGSGGDQWVTNAGTMILAGGTLDAGAVTNTGSVLGYGVLASALHNANTVLATNGLSSMLDLRGVVSGVGTYQVAKSNTLSFSGGGSISSSGLYNTNATIRIGAVIAGAALTNNTQFSNAGTLAMAGGTYYTPTYLTNGSTAWITGAGTIASGGAVVNQGTILANSGTLNPLIITTDLLNVKTGSTTGTVRASGGSLVVSGVFTNQGTLNFVNSAGTFNSAVFNSGAWQMINSDGYFAQNLAVTNGGYLTGDNGSVYTFRGDLVNSSTNNLAWSTLGTTPGTNTVGTGTQFLFSGTGLTQTQEFFQAGLLLRNGFVGTPDPLVSGVQTVDVSFATLAGFQNNFAVGQLWLTNTTLELAQAAPNTLVTNALFVNDLFLFGSSQLVISNNMRLYFVNSNSWDMAKITLLGNAEIHQLYSTATNLLVIPEPNVLLMWLSGVITLWAARRRRRNREI